MALIGVFWFEVPIRGSLLLLFVGTALYLMTTLGMGLLISTVSQTQQQAMMTTFFFFFPAMLLSGFAFPIANMPTVVQWLTLVNPMRYFLVIVRSIFLKGVGIEVLWPQMLPCWRWASPRSGWPCGGSTRRCSGQSFAPPAQGRWGRQRRPADWL